MKLIDLTEIDRGDVEIAQAFDRREQGVNNVWLIDNATGKKLAGPFADNNKADSFKKNRSDRIPPDARITRL